MNVAEHTCTFCSFMWHVTSVSWRASEVRAGSPRPLWRPPAVAQIGPVHQPLQGSTDKDSFFCGHLWVCVSVHLVNQLRDKYKSFTLFERTSVCVSVMTMLCVLQDRLISMTLDKDPEVAVQAMKLLILISEWVSPFLSSHFPNGMTKYLSSPISLPRSCEDVLSPEDYKQLFQLVYSSQRPLAVTAGELLHSRSADPTVIVSKVSRWEERLRTKKDLFGPLGSSAATPWPLTSRTQPTRRTQTLSPLQGWELCSASTMKVRWGWTACLFFIVHVHYLVCVLTKVCVCVCFQLHQHVEIGRASCRERV